MSTSQVRVERRASQRFEFQLPVSIRVSSRDGSGFTQDLSGRGVCFITDMKLVESEPVELTLMMPSEITLGESMRVRCQGQVKRIQALDIAGKSSVAVHFAGYDYLPAVTEIKTQYATPVSAHSDENGASAHEFDWRSTANFAHR
ncbi:MAG TPA: PilZ domain-containing protein [Terriglobales bacterium]|nr:PilZ domain-containing protein [Terriglobales bacterium]